MSSNNMSKTKIVNKSYKYRIYPSQEQIKFIEYNINSNRFIFNHVKATYEFYKKEVQRLNLPEIYANRKLFNMILKDLKKIYPFLKEADSTCLQSAYENLIQAHKNVGGGDCWVKFKSTRNPVQSYKTKSNKDSIKIIDGKLKINKLKSPIKIKLSRKINGKILSYTITRQHNNQYFASINLSKSIVIQNPKTGRRVGIDLGLKDFTTLSNGFKTGKIFLKKFDDRIARLNQELSCRVKNGKNWLKTKTKLARTYQSKKNKILNDLHWYSHKIVSDFDSISVGNVNSKLGLSNKRLAKTTSDQHWYEFKRQLEYKSDWYGKEFKLVDEKFTSKTCSSCGFQLEEMDLSVKKWECPDCGSVHDRDVNAARNIRTVGATGIAFGKTNNIVGGLGIYGLHSP
ncbi:MAG: IS200/IS605 family element transposase accessory protein TnpB [Methanobrevibacter sp. CfCl-M3]